MERPADDLVIRPATEADAETIVQAVRRLGHHVGIPEKVTSTAEDMRRYGSAPIRCSNA